MDIHRIKLFSRKYVVFCNQYYFRILGICKMYLAIQKDCNKVIYQILIRFSFYSGINVKPTPHLKSFSLGRFRVILD